MNFHGITQFDTANGLGIGTVLWVSGCSHHCNKCHNPQTWDKDSGKLFTQEDLEFLLDTLKSEHITRLTLSGGDPLYNSNRKQILQLIQIVKERHPSKSIWLYTGYKWEELMNDKKLRTGILRYVDVLVDGKFEIKNKSYTINYRGSTNQRVIDVKETILSGYEKLLSESCVSVVKILDV